MKISRQSALAVLAVLLVLLLLGTQMPWQLSKVAHFVVFAALAWAATRLKLLRF